MIPSPTLLTTAHVPPHERFDYWRDSVAGAFPDLELTPLGAVERFRFDLDPPLCRARGGN